MATCFHTGDLAHLPATELEKPCPHSFYCPVCRWYSGCAACDPDNKRYAREPQASPGLVAELEEIVRVRLERSDQDA